MISIRYYCSSNSIFCWIWKLHLLWWRTILIKHFSNTLWISSFYWNCIYIFNSMKIYQILLQLQLKLLVQIENWTRCDVWTIFSPRCTNTLWISNFHCNCTCIFNSMKIYQILLQLCLKVFSSNWKLNSLWCMDNIQYTFYKYNLSLKFSLILYLNHSFQWRFFG